MFILCLKIFFVRILDVSLGTIRTMFVVRGKKLISSMIGFFEILVWFLVVKEALQTESNSIFIAISYSLGFATGNYIGALLSDKLITGNVSVQVFTNNNNLEKILREHGYGVSSVVYTGYEEEAHKHMLFINIDKKKEKALRELIKKNDKEAFIIVNETKYVENGYFK
mgnify:FL=1|jgi:uncharacterized protein YebE (UPF0316 family)